jgi:hypothetical protein
MCGWGGEWQRIFRTFPHLRSSCARFKFQVQVRHHMQVLHRTMWCSCMRQGRGGCDMSSLFRHRAARVSRACRKSATAQLHSPRLTNDSSVQQQQRLLGCHSTGVPSGTPLGVTVSTPVHHTLATSLHHAARFILEVIVCRRNPADPLPTVLQIEDGLMVHVAPLRLPLPCFVGMICGCGLL